MPASSDLEKTIFDALDGSRYFILLASRSSAASEWVEIEAMRWLKSKGQEHFLIALTDPTVDPDTWGEDHQRSISKAIAARVLSGLKSQPRILDFTKLRESPTDAPAFLDAVASLAARIHGVDKDELVGQHLREQRRARMTIAAVITALSLLLVASSVASIVAAHHASIAQQRTVAATGRLLATEAARLAESDPEQALRLGSQAVELNNDPSNRVVLTDILRNTHYRGTGRLDDTGILDLNVSDDGQLVVTGGIDRRITFWSSQSNRPRRLRSSPIYTSQIFSTALHPGGRYVAVGDYDGNLAIEDYSNLEDIKLVTKLRAAESLIGALAFSPDGRYLAVGGASFGIRIYEFSGTGELTETTSLPSDTAADVFSLEYSEDGTRLATATSYGVTRLWDVHDVRSPHFLSAFAGATEPNLPGESLNSLQTNDGSHRVALRRDALLAVTANLDNTATVWDLSVPTRPTRVSLLIGHENYIDDVDLSNDGRWAVTVSHDRTAILWDLADIQRPIQVTTLRGVKSRMTSVDFDGSSRFFTSSADGSFINWSVSTDSTPLPSAQINSGDGSAINSVLISADGNMIIGGTEGGSLLLARRENGEWSVADTYDGGAEDTAFMKVALSRNGRWLAASRWSGEILLFDVQRKVFLPTASVLADQNLDAGLMFSIDGTVLFAGGFDRIFRWQLGVANSLVRQPDIWLGSSGDYTSALAVSLDGNQLAIGTGSGGIWLHYLDGPYKGKNFRVSDRSGGIRSLVFSADAKYLIASARETATVFGVEPGRITTTMSRVTATADISELELVLGDRWIVGSSHDGQTYVWDFSNGLGRASTQIARLPSGSIVWSVSSSASGDVITTGSSDGTARIWSTRALSDTGSSPVSVACDRAGELSQDDWVRYAGDLPYRRACK